MDKASYRSDLALSDFYLLGSLKKYLSGKRFAADTAASSRLLARGTSRRLLERRDSRLGTIVEKYLSVNCSNVEV